MAEFTLPEDYVDLLAAFQDTGAEFVIVGGWAVAAHGYARSTDDLDVFVRPSAENADRVWRALQAFGAPLEVHGVSPTLFATEGLGYRMGRKPRLIEILTAIDGVSFDEASADAPTVIIGGVHVRVIGRRALIRNKRAAGRPKDLADIAGLAGGVERA